jgi:hypothetical protein
VKRGLSPTHKHHFSCRSSHTCNLPAKPIEGRGELHKLMQHHAASEVQFQCVQLKRNWLEARNATGANASHPMDSSRVTMSDISQHPGSPGLTALFVPSHRGDRQASALRELPACSTTALDLDANQPHRRCGGAHCGLRAQK